LEQYGDSSFTSNSIPKPEESFSYLEYNTSGQAKSANETHKVARSKWDEDVLEGNHTCVWGSWWDDGKWGYACCHSTTRGSYCTGIHGIKADLESKERIKQFFLFFSYFLEVLLKDNQLIL